MRGQNRTHKGKYEPQNPEKYRGDPNSIIYRSSWEKRVMVFLDSNPNVLEWSSEEVVIPYIYSVDGRAHRYFVDFYAKVRAHDGTITKQLLEVKPHKETRPPKRSNKHYEEAMLTYIKNQDKWKHAQAFANKHGMEFKIITEKTLGIKH